jgi:hypothetical protein
VRWGRRALQAGVQGARGTGGMGRSELFYLHAVGVGAAHVSRIHDMTAGRRTRALTWCPFAHEPLCRPLTMPDEYKFLFEDGVQL